MSVTGRGLVSARVSYLVILAALSLIVFAVAGPVMGTHVAPQLFQGNPTCGDLGDYDHEFVIQANKDTGNVESGTYDDPASDFVVTITVNNTASGQTFDFTANLPVDAVFAKGGPGGNLYEYDPAVTADTGLHAPGNDSGKAVQTPPWSGLSHISFCFNEVPMATPTPTATPTATSTPETSVGGETATPTATSTPEQSVRGATGTPAPSTPNTAVDDSQGLSQLPTIVFAMLLIGSLGTLAWANVRSARRRS